MLYFVSVFGIIFCVCVVNKIILKLTTARHECYTCLVGKTMIVTGSNIGIGFHTALDFASRGAKVILACRSRSKAEDAQRRIVEETGNPNVSVELIDFASLQSVRDFARRINAKEDRLDILVNNAGAILFEDETSEDGLSLFMQVNYFGPFLLTSLLIDLLKRTGNSRIVNVSSRTAFHVEPKPADLNYFDTSYFSNTFYVNYARTKLYIILWTNELARRLKGTGVTVNSLHPGLIYTEILRNSRMMQVVFKYTQFLFTKTQEEGARTTIYVAISKDLQNVTGKFYDNCKEMPQPKSALDTKLGEKIWQNTESMIESIVK